MKRFIRTAAGKVMLFISVVLAVGVTGGCVLGAIAAAELRAYANTREEFVYDLTAERVEMNAWSCLYGVFGIESGDIYVSPDSTTNLRYQVSLVGGNVVARSERTDMAGNADSPKYYFYYGLVEEAENRNWIFLGQEREKSTVRYRTWGEKEGCAVYELCAYIDLNSEVDDIYTFTTWIANAVYSLRYAVYPIGLLALLVASVCFVALMCVSARKPGTDELYPGVLNRIPLEIMAAGIGGLIILNIVFFIDHAYFSILWIVLAVLGCINMIGLSLGLSMSIAARIKQKSLLTNTLIWKGIQLIGRILRRIGRWLEEMGRMLPMVWQSLLILAGITILELIALAMDAESYIGFWIIEKLILIPLILTTVLHLRKLQKGGEALAAGAFGYQVDTRGLHGALKQHAENLNNIGEGMAHAVNMRLKSERMKTELITNVSHDIKTPLTSIINYADLIGKEPCDNEKITEYAEVLTRQSERLKRLIEDLVEASKAATGNLKVDLSPCDAGIFIAQISGEYEQKFSEVNLELVTRVPQESVPVLADGRQMMRVFDNLMNNIYKYALAGTRVYLSLEKKGERAEIVFKNVSKQALEKNAEELMERFVRGDSSRNTEGNGLGLSIARSLTELQKGTLDLEVDGDLFKVILRFPIAEGMVPKEEEEEEKEE